MFACAVVCLAGAIGAATAVFAIVNGVVLGPLSFQHADRLGAIRWSHCATVADLFNAEIAARRKDVAVCMGDVPRVCRGFATYGPGRRPGHTRGPAISAPL